MNIVDVLNSELEGRRHKVWAQIDLSALVRNYKRIEKMSRGADVIPVIKADAYGHGAVRSMLALKQAGAKCFAVANVAEAIELKSSCADDIRLLILGYTPQDEVDLLSKYNITQTVFSLEYAKKLDDACESLGIDKISVHIKLDTGMNRLGFCAKDARAAADEIRSVSRLRHLCIEGMFTHFACADMLADPLTRVQCERFENVRRELGELDVGVCHVCNSAGIIRSEIPAYNAVRAGIILYGQMPSDDLEIDRFETVMSLRARIAHVHELEEGDAVSYGATFVADKKMKIATLPIGYADGFIRAYKNASVTVNGKECPIIGRICMDQCMIDVTGLDVNPDDEAILFDSREKIESLAEMSDTITYEVLCLIGKRVPRIYVEN
ncbi:MAG: alanine racemase [Clostridia bacterium]|nr:alanine racemase [Clostridia bacterium]